MCDCSDFTTGLTCEQCLDDYYGNALIGTSGDCQPCPCPDRTSCAQIAGTGQVVCTNCPTGRTGETSTNNVKLLWQQSTELLQSIGQNHIWWEALAAHPFTHVWHDFNYIMTTIHLCAHVGIRCQMCEDGYYGDPVGQSGPVRLCTRCECNGNVDFNALGICDHITGRCLKCLGHTEGDHCERCQQGFYGDAMNHTVIHKCKRK